jgi:hypothetical protein
MAFKSIVRERFGTGWLTCGEFDKAVESSVSHERLTGVTNAKPRNCRPERGVPEIYYKAVNGGKLVSNDGDLRPCFGYSLPVPPDGLKPMFHVEHLPLPACF